MALKWVYECHGGVGSPLLCGAWHVKVTRWNRIPPLPRSLILPEELGEPGLGKVCLMGLPDERLLGPEHSVMVLLSSGAELVSMASESQPFCFYLWGQEGWDASRIRWIRERWGWKGGTRSRIWILNSFNLKRSQELGFSWWQSSQGTDVLRVELDQLHYFDIRWLVKRCSNLFIWWENYYSRIANKCFVPAAETASPLQSDSPHSEQVVAMALLSYITTSFPETGIGFQLYSWKELGTSAPHTPSKAKLGQEAVGNEASTSGYRAVFLITGDWTTTCPPTPHFLGKYIQYVTFRATNSHCYAGCWFIG